MFLSSKNLQSLTWTSYVIQFEYGPFGESQSERQPYLAGSQNRMAQGSTGVQPNSGVEGEFAAFRSSGTAPCNFGFSTKYRDSETGLNYYGYRYYSAGLGRWLGRDPIGIRGGKNLYPYLKNNPINRIDYLGLIEVEKDFDPSSESAITSYEMGPLQSSKDRYVGGSTYPEMDVKFEVNDSECKIKSTLYFRAKIVIASDLSYPIISRYWGSYNGIFGHEQKHVASYLRELDKIKTEIDAENEALTNNPDSRIAALTSKYKGKLSAILKLETDHKNDFSPKEGPTSYPPNPQPDKPFPDTPFQDAINAPDPSSFTPSYP